MKAWHIVLLLACIVASFFAGYCFRPVCAENARTRIDTFIQIDTISKPVPYPVYETVIMEVPEMFPVYITLEGDTVNEPIFVPMPITQKEYLTEDYHAWVSGYSQSLDSIDIFKETRYITKYKPTRRWGIGIMVGYGIGRNGLSPYLGAGVYYRIW